MRTTAFPAAALPAPRVLALLALIVGCVMPVEAQPASRPIVLFWTRHVEHVPGATYVTPAPTGGGSEAGGAGAALHPTQLKTLDGKVIADGRTPRELADYWTGAATRGYEGITIDEFGHVDPAVNTAMAEALALADARRPDLFIAVWHAGGLTEELARAYGEHADLVLLEAYFSGTDRLPDRFQAKLDAARRAGILHKTLFALGMNDLNPRVADSLQPWANSPAELAAQMRWIKANAPEMPGIAFFAPNASEHLLRSAYELAVSIFGSGHEQPSTDGQTERGSRLP